MNDKDYISIWKDIKFQMEDIIFADKLLNNIENIKQKYDFERNDAKYDDDIMIIDRSDSIYEDDDDIMIIEED